MSKVQHMWQETVTDNGIVKECSLLLPSFHKLIARQEGEVVKACIEIGMEEVVQGSGIMLAETYCDFEQAQQALLVVYGFMSLRDLEVVEEALGKVLNIDPAVALQNAVRGRGQVNG